MAGTISTVRRRSEPPPVVARRRVRWAGRILAALATTFVVWLGTAGALTFGFLHPARTPVTRTPRELGLRYEIVSFRSDDSLRLRGWFVPVAGKQAPRGVIVVCHGYPGNRSDLLQTVGFLHRANFVVLAFDFCALGESEGDTCTIGYKEVGDALAAVAYLKRRTDTKNLPLGILGASMGGAVALQAAAQSSDIRAVVADSPYASLDRAVDQRFRCYTGATGAFVMGTPVRWMGDKMLGASAAHVAPLAKIGKISPRPVFLIVGDADWLILPQDSELLYKAARQPKQLWRIPGAGHIGGYGVAGAEYERRVSAFFHQTLGGEQRRAPRPQVSTRND